MDRTCKDKSVFYIRELINDWWKAIHDHYFYGSDLRTGLNSCLDEMHFNKCLYSSEIQDWLQRGIDLLDGNAEWFKEGENLLRKAMSQQDSMPPIELHYWLKGYQRNETVPF